MSNAAPQPQGLADDDPSVVRAEGRLRLLRELTEIGMKLARGLEPAPVAADGETGRSNGLDPADAFARLHEHPGAFVEGPTADILALPSPRTS